MILQLLNERSGKFKFHEECFKFQLLKHAEIVIFYVSSFSQIRNVVKETGSYKSVEVTFLRLWKYCLGVICPGENYIIYVVLLWWM